MFKKVAIVGLGYVGLPLALEFGRIRPTIGFDISESRIQELCVGKDSSGEVAPEAFKLAQFLQFTSDTQALTDIQIYIVAVPTPVDKSNSPDLSLLIKASQMVGNHLKPGDIVVYESTVYPGATEEICVPVLEKCSGLKYVHHANQYDIKSDDLFYCGYSPERINPGDKNHTLTSIKKVTSGSTAEIATEIDNLYSEIISAGTYKASSIKIAEAAKVIENSQRDLNIAFINELAILFSKLNIDTTEVLEAASTKWNFLNFKPGLVGGHCIGVDPFYLAHKAKQVGYATEVILAGRRVNDSIPIFIANRILKKISETYGYTKGSVIHVLGITFKENCRDIRNSKVINLVRELQEGGCEVIVSDPIANPQDVWEEFGIVIKNDCFDKAIPPCHFLVVAVEHEQYLSINQKDFLSLFISNVKPLIFDVKSIFNKPSLIDLGFEVFRL